MPQEKTPTFVDDLDLPRDFEAPDLEDWRAVVERSLGGRGPEELVSQTHEGIDIPPLYGPGDDRGVSGIPGASPFVRGSTALGNVETGWRVCEAIDFGSCSEAVGSAVARGVDAVRVSDAGIPPNVQVDDLAPVTAALVEHAVELHLDAGWNTPGVLVLLVAAARRRGDDPAAISGSVGFDPLGALAVDGMLPFSFDRAMDLVASIVEWTPEHMPRMRAVAVSTLPHAEAGATAVQEIAYAAASGLEYLRSLTTRGQSLDASCCQIGFVTGIGRDFFTEIAKLRALRRIWSRIVEAAGGAEYCQAAPIHAVTSPRTLTVRDRWVNVLRTTVQVSAAAIGGAETITVLPSDAASDGGDETARRVAVNTHALLREESGLHRVIDPAGGSWYVEELSAQLADESWRLFQEIEREGGMLQALLDGVVQVQLAESMSGRREAIARREDPITGVSTFPDLSEETPQLSQAAGEIATSGGSGNRAVTEELRQLSHVERDRLVEAAIEVAERGASLEQLCQALGAETSSVHCSPLVRERESRAFDRLRDASDAWKAESGEPPLVFIASFGEAADIRARVSFVRDLLATGGIEADGGVAWTNAQEAKEAFVASPSEVAVICSTDANSELTVPDLAAELKRAGAKAVLVAASPKLECDEWNAAGVDGMIWAGCDVPSVVEEVLVRMGVIA